MPYTYDTYKKRFIKKVVLQNETGCWIWKGAVSNWHTPVFRYMGACETALKVSWVLYKDTEAPDRIAHICNDKSCVNPEHLEAFTPQGRKPRVRGRKLKPPKPTPPPPPPPHEPKPKPQRNSPSVAFVHGPVVVSFD